jgi:hypothetical protein
MFLLGCTSNPTLTMQGPTNTGATQIETFANPPPSTKTAPTPTPATTPSLTLTPTPTSTPAATPMPTPATPNTTAPAVKSVTITDPSDDLFDALGKPIKDQSYLDIVEATITTSGSDYLGRIKLNGSFPTQPPDAQTYLEWTIYLDDNNLSAGVPWPIVTNDVRQEYLVRLFLLDSIYKAQLFEMNTKKSTDIRYSITNNIIELLWPKTFSQSDSFIFVVATKKYGQRGAPSAFILADKTPNQGHASFP